MKGSYPNQYVDYRQSGFGFQQPYVGGTGQTPAFGTQPFYPQMPAGAGMPTGAGMQTTPPPGLGAGGGTAGAQPQIPGMLPLEQSYIENILRLNKGKLTTVHASFDGDGPADRRTFTGIIEAAGRDHLILSDPQTGRRTLIPMVFFNYATFDEELEYEYPFGGSPGVTTYPPR
ncbi:spore coat protein GerQ [Bacillus massilinigeriensis]|uniref:spore coat protein GerQ n=1 Tax=Bacillus massilionigeriensis TaxID=1805475 RepID=UPI00096B5E1F|nr:spore coat protein GerQ [Bacillus massilionigeriensis]